MLLNYLTKHGNTDIATFGLNAVLHCFANTHKTHSTL